MRLDGAGPVAQVARLIEGGRGPQSAQVGGEVRREMAHVAALVGLLLHTM